MKKLTLTKCKICGEEKTSRGFSFHISRKHNMKIEDYNVVDCFYTVFGERKDVEKLEVEF